MPLPRAHRSALLLFLVCASVYFATFTGITASNDGSHYALVRALVDRRSFEISPFLDFAENQDYAIGPNGKYTDRPPGTALWSAPFYLAAALLPPPLVDVPSKHDRGNPRLLGVAAACAVASAGAVALFYLLLREHFALSHFASGAAAVALGFGTATWKYGSVLYSHGLSALCILAGFWLAARTRRCPSPRTALALGLVIGFGVVVEYSNLLLVPLVLLYARPRLPLLAGLALPGAFLAWYDWHNFGSPFRVSTFQVDLTRWPTAAGPDTFFATPLLEGLAGMLWWGHDNQGLFLLAPIAALGLLGIAAFWRAGRAEAILFLGTFVLYLLLFSTSTNFNPLTNDGRYLVPFYGLWLVPLAFWIERRQPLALGSSLLLFGLLFLSVRNAFMHVAFSWNYDLHYRDLLDGSTPLPNVARLLALVFPNAPNVWWLWLLLGLLIGAASIVTRARAQPT